MAERLPCGIAANHCPFNLNARGARVHLRCGRFSRLPRPARRRTHNMPSKMLIDAAHPEETRVVVVKGNRVEEFDYESANKKQLRGNIYLAKVTRVEPSLQAAFVDYGGNRHGFLAFSEIHPDYYQIPVADRQALLDEESRAHRDEDEEQEHRGSRRRGRSRHRNADRIRSEPIEGGGEQPAEVHAEGDAANNGEAPAPISNDAYAEAPHDHP